MPSIHSEGADFFEQRFGAVVLRCDTLLANVEILDGESGTSRGLFIGLDGVRDAIAFWAGREPAEMAAALARAEVALAEAVGEWELPDETRHQLEV